MATGIYTRAEIDQQSQAWAETLAGFSRQRKSLSEALTGLEKQAWLVTGCGSTHYASLSAAALLRREGHEVRVHDVNNELFHETFKSRPHWKYALTAHSQDPHAAIFREEGERFTWHAQDILAGRPDAVVLKADYATRASRLVLCDLTARVLKQGLDVLGIETVEQM